MATGTIVSTWDDGANAFAAVRVNEGASQGNVEYLASVPLSELAGKTNPEKRELLRVAVKAARDRQQGGRNDLGLSGSVAL